MNFLKKIIFIFSVIYGTFLMAQETEYSSKKKDSIYESINGHPQRVKRFSFGAKIGIPSLAGGSVEIVLPFLNNHFAPFIDYSNFLLSFENVETDLSFLGFGAKYYFGEKGSGFFISIGRSSLETDIIFNDLLYQDNTTQQSIQGSGGTSLKLDTSNFKFGIKTEGTVYFLLELGYGVGKIPSEITFTSISNGITDTFTEKIPSLPGVGINGILIANVGFGFAF